MPLPLFSEIVCGLLEADLTAAVTFDAIQHFIDTRPQRQPAQLRREVLLQRLATLLSPALQSSVHILRYIPYQYVRHAYIMLSVSCTYRQAVHRRPSPQVTVLPRPSKTVRVRACCGTPVLYAEACHGTVPRGTAHCTGWPVARVIRSNSLS